MKKVVLILLTIGVVLGILAVTVGPKIYRDYFVEPAASQPNEVLNNTPTDAVNVSELHGQWEVGDDSYAGYRVDEVLNGTDVTVTGRTDDVDGQFTVQNNQLTAAKVDVEVADIQTDAQRRDNYFKTQVVDTQRYPVATFTLTDEVALDKGIGDTYPVKGTLALNGVEKTVTVDISTAYADDEVKVAGVIPIVFSDYQMTAPNLGFVKVEDRGQIEFLLNLDRED